MPRWYDVYKYYYDKYMEYAPSYEEDKEGWLECDFYADMEAADKATAYFKVDKYANVEDSPF